MDGPLLHLVLRTSKNVQGGTTMSAQDIIKSIEDAQKLLNSKQETL